MSFIEDEPPPVLLPCTVCSRTFRPEVLERHIKVCEKTASKKRRVFDSFKNRVSGTELEEFWGPAPLPGQTPKCPVKSPVKKPRGPPKWKETHENLIAVLRAARGAELSADVVPEPPKHSGNEKCPSCNRFFGPRAFDRHVEFCKEKTARIKMTPSKVSQAQERLEARTKYRAPLSIKPKLTTKEKYSPMLPRKESTESCAVSSSSAKTSPPIPTLNRNPKTAKPNSSHFSRQSPIRNSERQRSVSPTKKSLVSNSKSSIKSETHPKSTNHPKIKENLKNSEDLRPKTGTKLTTQEKIRSNNLKLSQLEDEIHKLKSISKKTTREKAVYPKSYYPSDDESVGTADSEGDEKRGRRGKSARSKWSSAESISNLARKEKRAGRKSAEDDKTVLVLAPRADHEFAKPKTGDSKLRRKKQKPQINDLSVNDESFGIFVAACPLLRPPSSRAKTSKGSTEKPNLLAKDNIICADEEKRPKKTETKRETNHPKKKPEPELDLAPQIKPICGSELPTHNSIPQTKNSDKIYTSKIPKAKSATGKKHPEIPVPVADSATLPEETDDVDLDEPEKDEGDEDCRTVAIKKKAKKWRNIADMSTEDLVKMSEDFSLPEEEDFSQELSESTIFEIAAEQFLKSEDSVQCDSTIFEDSLNEYEIQKNLGVNGPDKTGSGGDDFIVLHVTDPAKLLENDADMKLSLSEPCFPYSDKKVRDKWSDGKKIDIVVFTAVPRHHANKIAFHRKRKKQKKQKQPKSVPKFSRIREKTFLANDFPKTKRRKLRASETSLPSSIDLRDFFFETSSKEEMNERKKKFIEGLKSQREKIREWQTTANSHMKCMEEFQKSVEDDLKELKRLSKGKRTRRKSYFREFKREKMKEIKNEGNKTRNPVGGSTETGESRSGRKKFEYFVIDFEDVGGTEDERCGAGARESAGKPKPDDKDAKGKKFECFEISIDDFKPKREKNSRKESSGPGENKKPKTPSKKNSSLAGREKHLPKILESVKEVEGHTDSKMAGGDVIIESRQPTTHQNSSLENIEEEDEEEEKVLEDEEVEEKKSEDEKKNFEEPTNNYQKDIDVEDFILSKPNAEKILSDGDLDELFPKPREIAETVTSAESPTAVPLGFIADSVFDLKSKPEKKVKGGLPQMPAAPSRMLEKRVKRGSELPKILVKETEKKENSMISLIKLWRDKKENLECEKMRKVKATLPSGKLAPLSNKNSFQIRGDESYDPFKQAERQMLALLSWPSTVDIKTAKDFTPKPKPGSQPKSNLETSPSSAFTKYPNKDDKPAKKNVLNETFELDNEKNSRNEKPTYAAADDWEQIFEKHFDLNRNEMTDQMTRSVKSALDGLLKNSLKNSPDLSDDPSAKNKNDLTDNSIITDVLYTSTPKQNPKSDKAAKARSKDATPDFDRTPHTYGKSSNFACDRITPPEDFNDPCDKAKANRNSGISLSSLSFCSQISDTTLADEEVMRSNLEIIGKAAAAAAAKTPRRKYARSQSVFDERNKMLFAKTYDPNSSSSDENDVLPKLADKQGKKSPSRNPKSVPSRFSRSHSVMDDRGRGDGDHSDDGDHISSPESNRNRKAKLSGDSAYSSLNRRSPRQNNQKNQQEDRLSSSGSEHSLPTVNNDFDLKAKSLDLDGPAKKDQPVKMSKFCHECGSKYPVAVAKFCCECGVRRLII